MAKQKSKKIQSPRGMHDILPADQPYWLYIQKRAASIMGDYGFDKIDLPLLEHTALFQRSVGEATDIVEKEMYNFKTRGGDEFSLRPEFTAGSIRAYIEHGMHVMPHPVRLWSYGPVFRHDNPQAGRLRQFHQLNIESIGDGEAVVDAELIFMAYKFLESIGLKNVVIKINSIGDSSCRPQYIKALKDFYRNRIKKICGKCKGRIKTNPLRVLDCVEANCIEVAKDAPQIVDYLDADCKKHFKSVLEFLDEIGVPYLLDHHLVRGLDYYTRTVFEFWPEEKNEEGQPPSTNLAIISGGRYDKLVGLLGGQETPAVGWAMGIERAILLLKERNIHVPESKAQPKVFLAQLSEMGRRKSLLLFEELRKASIAVKSSFGRDSIKSQLRIANKFGVIYTLIIGQKEALDDSVMLREMRTGVQENIPIEKIVDVLKKRLKK